MDTAFVINKHRDDDGILNAISTIVLQVHVNMLMTLSGFETCMDMVHTSLVEVNFRSLPVFHP